MDIAVKYFHGIKLLTHYVIKYMLFGINYHFPLKVQTIPATILGWPQTRICVQS